MTTIAWDGITLACDSQGTSGNRKMFGLQKIVSEPGDISIFGARVILIGCSGTSGDERHVVQYLAQGGATEQKEMHAEIDCLLILITEENRCFVFHKNEGKKLPWIYEKQPPYAIGSGCDFAISAMKMGKDAAEAVEFAKQLDVYTGGEVICYPCKR